MCGITNITVQIGINTENPTNTLHIVGDTANVHGQAFRLVDGNEGVGKILMSDENGAGTWSSTPIDVADTAFTAVNGWTIEYNSNPPTNCFFVYGAMVLFRLNIITDWW